MTQAMCTTFKRELFEAKHNFLSAGGHEFKIALFTAAVTLNAATTSYTGLSNEVSSVNYTAGGFAFTRVDPAVGGTTAYVTFASNPQWSGVTFAPTQALVYNNSLAGKNAVAVLDFGGPQNVSAGTFTINLPTADASTALLRLE